MIIIKRMAKRIGKKEKATRLRSQLPEGWTDNGASTLWSGLVDHRYCCCTIRLGNTNDKWVSVYDIQWVPRVSKIQAFLKTKDRTIEKPMKKSSQTIGVLIRPLLVDICVMITERGRTNHIKITVACDVHNTVQDK